MNCSRVIKPVQMPYVDLSYQILRVEKLPSRDSNGERHFILTILKGVREGHYILPLHDVFAQNENIQINNNSMFMEMIISGIDPTCYLFCSFE